MAVPGDMEERRYQNASVPGLQAHIYRQNFGIFYEAAMGI
jgi:hypothetical protein